MRSLSILLLIVGVIFLVYAIASHYSNTPTDQSSPKRMWLAIVAAASALSATVLSLIHGWTAP